MKVKNIIRKTLQLGLIIITPMVFIACGGGGGDSSYSNEEIDITVTCLTTSPAAPNSTEIATYQELFSGDKIVKDTDDTIIQLYTPLNENSRVCIESGLAHIIRN